MQPMLCIIDLHAGWTVMSEVRIGCWHTSFDHWGYALP